MEKILQHLEPRAALLTMVALVLLVSAALFSYALLPEIKDYRSSSHTLKLLRQVAGKGTALEAEITALEEEVASLGHQLHGDMTNLPARQMEAFIIGRLQKISWQNSVDLLGVRPGKGNVVKVFEEVVFDVEIAGDYFDLFAWLQDLGDELGFIVVKHFTIKPLDSDRETPRLKVNLTVVSYREAVHE